MQSLSSRLDEGAASLMSRPVLLLSAILFGGMAGFLVSYGFKPLYSADAVLIPSDEMLGLNASSSLGSLTGLASLVGMGAGGNKESEAIETLQSRSLAMEYIKANDLLPVLFHSRWDATRKTWKVGPLQKQPTLEDAYRVFDKKIRTVVENHKTGLVTISITWENPELAKKWADDLVSAANRRLRDQAIARSEKNLEYLRKSSEATSVMEVRSAIYKLMETEIKKQMVAFGGADYAFRIVDPPVVPERKVFPSRALFAVLGGFLAVATLFIALVSKVSRSKIGP